LQVSDEPPEPCHSAFANSLLSMILASDYLMTLSLSPRIHDSNIVQRQEY
jgi:hypothetical protein